MSCVVARTIRVIAGSFLTKDRMFVNLSGRDLGQTGISRPNDRMMGSLRYDPRMAERRRNAGVTDEAIEQIRVLVASGEWGPGTRLPREADLAAQLGLSRNSLREAVRALSLARVLEVRQGDGTYVSSLEPGELLEPT